MKLYKIKEYYSKSPIFLKPILLLVSTASILYVVFIINNAYNRHVTACNDNKQDDFFWLKCYAKPDTVLQPKYIYVDTCLTNNQPVKNQNNGTNNGNMNIGDKH